MQGTSTTTRRTSADTVAAKVAPIAMYAIAEFMLEHRLPAPMAIKAPPICAHADAEDRAVTVLVYSRDYETWCEAIDATYVGTSSQPVDDEVLAVVTSRGTVPTPIGDVAVIIRMGQRTGVPVRHGRPALVVVGGEPA